MEATVQGFLYNEDLCPASQAAKKAQLPLLKQAKSEGKVAYFRHTRLIIKEKRTNVISPEVIRPRVSEESSEAVADEVVDEAPLTAVAAEADGGRFGSLSGGSRPVSGEPAVSAGGQDHVGAVGRGDGRSRVMLGASADGCSSTNDASSPGSRQATSSVSSHPKNSATKNKLRKRK